MADTTLSRQIDWLNARCKKLREQLTAKDRDRQYHMDAVNRLAAFLALTGTSFEVVQAAMDNLTRLATECAELRGQLAVAQHAMAEPVGTVNFAVSAELDLPIGMKLYGTPLFLPAVASGPRQPPRPKQSEAG